MKRLLHHERHAECLQTEHRFEVERARSALEEKEAAEVHCHNLEADITDLELHFHTQQHTFEVEVDALQSELHSHRALLESNKTLNGEVEDLRDSLEAAKAFEASTSAEYHDECKHLSTLYKVNSEELVQAQSGQVGLRWELQEIIHRHDSDAHQFSEKINEMKREMLSLE